MTISLSLPRTIELKPRIVVIGVGGAGGNAVNNMIGSGLDGVEFVVANTDAQALALSKADRKVQLGGGITQGLGAGMRPEIGEQSAEESLDEILEHLEGAHMLFVAAGMGGGTGTGAAPVIARAARERGILTVGIVTKPFMFEGTKRMKLADQGIENLYGSVDTMITIPNQNLFRVATDQTTMTDAFAMADEVLHSGVRGVTDLMVVPGLINLDFNDVRTVMDEMGKAMMGTGEATGDRRAIEAAEAAINNPLLDDVSLKGAKGVLINITGGSDLTLYEVDEAANLIRSQVDEDANIIVGSALESDLDGIVRVSVVATGVETEYAMDSNPVPTRRLKEVAKSFEVQENSFALSTENIDTGVNNNSFDDQEFNNLETDVIDTKTENAADLNDVKRHSEVSEEEYRRRNSY
jgi:cell division protein FtsZ